MSNQNNRPTWQQIPANRPTWQQIPPQQPSNAQMQTDLAQYFQRVQNFCTETTGSQLAHYAEQLAIVLRSTDPETVKVYDLLNSLNMLCAQMKTAAQQVPQGPTRFVPGTTVQYYNDLVAISAIEDLSDNFLTIALATKAGELINSEPTQEGGDMQDAINKYLEPFKVFLSPEAVASLELSCYKKALSYATSKLDERKCQNHSTKEQ